MLSRSNGGCSGIPNGTQPRKHAVLDWHAFAAPGGSAWLETSPNGRESMAPRITMGS
jgi:hypothetical protein